MQTVEAQNSLIRRCGCSPFQSGNSVEIQNFWVICFLEHADRDQFVLHSARRLGGSLARIRSIARFAVLQLNDNMAASKSDGPKTLTISRVLQWATRWQSGGWEVSGEDQVFEYSETTSVWDHYFVAHARGAESRRRLNGLRHRTVEEERCRTDSLCQTYNRTAAKLSRERCSQELRGHHGARLA